MSTERPEPFPIPTFAGCYNASILMCSESDEKFYGGKKGEIVYRWRVCGGVDRCTCNIPR